MREGDGIRLNGTECVDGQDVQTWEAWYNGVKLVGPSPSGNFLSESDAQTGYDEAKNLT